METALQETVLGIASFKLVKQGLGFFLVFAFINMQIKVFLSENTEQC